MELFELLDKPSASGEEVIELFRENNATKANSYTVTGTHGKTDAVKILIAGKKGKSLGGNAPTLGIIGRLGGLGARPGIMGFVSDGDGALAALSAGLKLAQMNCNGDILEGDVIIATHICPASPVSEHKPVPFMGSPVDMETMNRYEVDAQMDAVLSIDTTKGNRVINACGFSISPTVKEGYILKVSDDLMDVMTRVTGKMPLVFPLSQQDITPYGNDLFHLNSILQPATATDAPVVGVAITTEQPVAGCATGASHPADIEAASRFAVEVAKSYTQNNCEFYNIEEFDHIRKLYGDMKRFQTIPKR
jgi:Protein of unknown function (DUF1177).